MPVTTIDDIATLAECKLHLRVDHDDEDTLISAYLAAAVADISTYLRYSLLPSSRVDHFRACEVYGSGKKVFLRSCFVETTGLEVALFDAETADYIAAPAADYSLQNADSNPHILFKVAPTLDDANADAEVIRVTYATQLETVEPQVKAAVLLLLGSFYEHREDVVTGATSRKIPLSVEYLLAPLRFVRL